MEIQEVKQLFGDDIASSWIAGKSFGTVNLRPSSKLGYSEAVLQGRWVQCWLDPAVQRTRPPGSLVMLQISTALHSSASSKQCIHP